MKKLKFAITFVLLCFSFSTFAQTRPIEKRIKITGVILDKTSQQPL